MSAPTPSAPADAGWWTYIGPCLVAGCYEGLWQHPAPNRPGSPCRVLLRHGEGEPNGFDGWRCANRRCRGSGVHFFDSAQRTVAAWCAAVHAAAGGAPAEPGAPS